MDEKRWNQLVLDPGLAKQVRARIEIVYGQGDKAQRLLKIFDEKMKVHTSAQDPKSSESDLRERFFPSRRDMTDAQRKEQDERFRIFMLGRSLVGVNAGNRKEVRDGKPAVETAAEKAAAEKAAAEKAAFDHFAKGNTFEKSFAKADPAELAAIRHGRDIYRQSQE